MVFRRAKRQLNSAAATKTRERLRPYAAAESLGSLAGEGRTLRTATWSVHYAQGSVDLAMSRRVPVPATAFACIAKTLSEKLCSSSVCVKYTGAASVLILGEAVSERGAVGTSEGEKASEWHRGDKDKRAAQAVCRG